MENIYEKLSEKIEAINNRTIAIDTSYKKDSEQYDEKFKEISSKLSELATEFREYKDKFSNFSTSCELRKYDVGRIKEDLLSLDDKIDKLKDSIAETDRLALNVRRLVFAFIIFIFLLVVASGSSGTDSIFSVFSQAIKFLIGSGL